MMKRVFIGVNLPDEVKEEVYDRASKHKDIKFRPTAAENIHLTLRFIGNASEDQIQVIEKRLTEVAKKNGAFNMKLTGAGAFPSTKRARVAWIGISDGSEQIKELAWECEKTARKLGFKEESRFHPHITFARLKVPQNVGELLSHISASPKLNGKEVKVDRLTLFESKLKPSGAEYSILQEFIF